MAQYWILKSAQHPKVLGTVRARHDPTVVPVENPFASDGDCPEMTPLLPRPDDFQPKYYSVADYHRLYLCGELTPLAVAKALLPLIRRDTTPKGEHSVAWFDTKVDQVLVAAKASTLRYQKKSPLGPLDGVPTAVKDEYEIDGYRTCLGSVNDYTAEAAPGESITSWCVKKIEEAGMVNLGKLSMHEFGLGMMDYFLWLLNPTRTPLRVIFFSVTADNSHLLFQQILQAVIQSMGLHQIRIIQIITQEAAHQVAHMQSVLV